MFCAHKLPFSKPNSSVEIVLSLLFGYGLTGGVLTSHSP